MKRVSKQAARLKEEIEGFLKEQKSANTLKKTTTNMNTVARSMKDIGKNVKVENLPAAELDRLLRKFFMNIRKKNWQEYEPDSTSGFQRSIQRYLSERGSPVKKGCRCETQVAYSWTRQR